MYFYGGEEHAQVRRRLDQFADGLIAHDEVKVGFTTSFVLMLPCSMIVAAQIIDCPDPG